MGRPGRRAGATGAGRDYRRPGALSRTAGIEQALPGPTLPPVGQVALDAARGAVLPPLHAQLAECGLPVSGARGEPGERFYDPVPASPDPAGRRLGELVQRQTGHPLSGPSNVSLLLDLQQQPDHPLLQQAARDTERQGLYRNLVSLGFPVPVSGTTAAAERTRAVRQQFVPYGEIAAAEARGDRAGAEHRRRTNAVLQTLYPEAATYDNTSAEGRERLIMQAYDRQNARFKGQPGEGECRAAFQAWVEAGMPGTFDEWASRYTVKR